jgi:hypothetical protein
MSGNLQDEPVCPIGHDFLTLLSKQEDACEAESRDRLPVLGKKTPACVENLGTVLSLLDRAASCFWSCRGGDHIIEYLAGRVCSGLVAGFAVRVLRRIAVTYARDRRNCQSSFFGFIRLMRT